MFESTAPSVFHRLHRIQYQVHQHLLDHVPIEHDIRQPLTESRFQHDSVRGKEVRRQDQHPIDDVIDVRRRELRLILLGEVEELPNNLCTRRTPSSIETRYSSSRLGDSVPFRKL